MYRLAFFKFCSFPEKNLLSYYSFRIEHYLNEKQPLPIKLNQPFCTSEFLFSMKSYDHLKGVAERKFLQNITEDGLVNPIPQVKNLPEFGHKVHLALQNVGNLFCIFIFM